jgi:hypothetical protein
MQSLPEDPKLMGFKGAILLHCYLLAIGIGTGSELHQPLAINRGFYSHAFNSTTEVVVLF